jgi:hypothetical protein
MFSRMMKLVNQTDSLYLSANQQKQLLDYGASLGRRFAAIRSLERQENAIVELALQAWQQAHAELGTPEEFGWDSAENDLRLVLRSLAISHLMDDLDYAEARVLRHLRRTLEFADVPADAIRDLFACLVEAVREKLEPADFSQLENDLQRSVAAAEAGLMAVS